jgi:hypothetical protein
MTQTIQFGIDRLLADLAGASGIGDADLVPRARCAGRLPGYPPCLQPSARNMVCAATSRTTWSSRRTIWIRSSAYRSSASTARCAGRPTAMMDSFDVLLVDLQDLGCRIYTFITTLRYVLEEAARTARRYGCWIGRIRPGARSKG